MYVGGGKIGLYMCIYAKFVLVLYITHCTTPPFCMFLPRYSSLRDERVCVRECKSACVNPVCMYCLSARLLLFYLFSWSKILESNLMLDRCVIFVPVL